jgi:hypothetical protein
MRSLPTESETDMCKVRPIGIAISLGVLFLYAGFAAPRAAAQTSDTYKVRLTTVPVDASMMARITGSGALTGVLAGNKLTITGNFSGLRSPATDAHIHLAPKALRGPAILDLDVSKMASGSVSGTVTLTPAQVEDLKNGRLYIQINSQSAPEGNLWGWLLR